MCPNSVDYINMYYDSVYLYFRSVSDTPSSTSDFLCQNIDPGYPQSVEKYHSDLSAFESVSYDLNLLWSPGAFQRLSGHRSDRLLFYYIFIAEKLKRINFVQLSFRIHSMVLHSCLVQLFHLCVQSIVLEFWAVPSVRSLTYKCTNWVLRDISCGIPFRRS